MMSGEHTPGPWEWWTSNSWRRLRHSERGVSTDVLMPCVHNDGQPDINVNAADMALIAAAPELLASLQIMLGFVALLEKVLDDPAVDPGGPKIRAHCDRARAAIAKIGRA